MENQVRVLCHDYRSLMRGTIERFTERGCVLVCDPAMEKPVLPRKTRAFLNLFDERSGRTENVSVRLAGLERVEGCWRYRIIWAEVPPMLCP